MTSSCRVPRSSSSSRNSASPLSSSSSSDSSPPCVRWQQRGTDFSAPFSSAAAVIAEGSSSSSSSVYLPQSSSSLFPISGCTPRSKLVGAASLLLPSCSPSSFSSFSSSEGVTWTLVKKTPTRVLGQRRGGEEGVDEEGVGEEVYEDTFYTPPTSPLKIPKIGGERSSSLCLLSSLDGISTEVEGREGNGVERRERGERRREEGVELNEERRGEDSKRSPIVTAVEDDGVASPAVFSSRSPLMPSSVSRRVSRRCSHLYHPYYSNRFLIRTPAASFRTSLPSSTTSPFPVSTLQATPPSIFSASSSSLASVRPSPLYPTPTPLTGRVGTPFNDRLFSSSRWPSSAVRSVHRRRPLSSFSSYPLRPSSSSSPSASASATTSTSASSSLLLPVLPSSLASPLCLGREKKVDHDEDECEERLYTTALVESKESGEDDGEREEEKDVGEEEEETGEGRALSSRGFSRRCSETPDEEEGDQEDPLLLLSDDKNDHHESTDVQNSRQRKGGKNEYFSSGRKTLNFRLEEANGCVESTSSATASYIPFKTNDNGSHEEEEEEVCEVARRSELAGGEVGRGRQQVLACAREEVEREDGYGGRRKVASPTGLLVGAGEEEDGVGGLLPSGRSSDSEEQLWRWRNDEERRESREASKSFHRENIAEGKEKEKDAAKGTTAAVGGFENEGQRAEESEGRGLAAASRVASRHPLSSTRCLSLSTEEVVASAEDIAVGQRGRKRRYDAVAEDERPSADGPGGRSDGVGGGEGGADVCRVGRGEWGAQKRIKCSNMLTLDDDKIQAALEAVDRQHRRPRTPRRTNVLSMSRRRGGLHQMGWMVWGRWPDSGLPDPLTIEESKRLTEEEAARKEEEMRRAREKEAEEERRRKKIEEEMLRRRQEEEEELRRQREQQQKLQQEQQQQQEQQKQSLSLAGGAIVVNSSSSSPSSLFSFSSTSKAAAAAVPFTATSSCSSASTSIGGDSNTTATVPKPGTLFQFGGGGGGGIPSSSESSLSSTSALTTSSGLFAFGSSNVAQTKPVSDASASASTASVSEATGRPSPFASTATTTSTSSSTFQQLSPSTANIFGEAGKSQTGGGGGGFMSIPPFQQQPAAVFGGMGAGGGGAAGMSFGQPAGGMAGGIFGGGGAKLFGSTTTPTAQPSASPGMMATTSFGGPFGQPGGGMATADGAGGVAQGFGTAGGGAGATGGANPFANFRGGGRSRRGGGRRR